MCASVITKFLTYISSTHFCPSGHSFVFSPTFIDCQPRQAGVFMMGIRIGKCHSGDLFMLMLVCVVCVNIHACVEQLPHSSSRTDCWLPGLGVMSQRRCARQRSLMAAIDFGAVSGSGPLYHFPVGHLWRNAAMVLWRWLSARCHINKAGR